MREIKFRAWYEKSQTWVYFDLNKGFTSDVALQVYSDLVLDGATFYQFTGLLDKEGKEIYEGDKVTTAIDSGVVIFFEQYSSFMIDCDGILFNIFETEKVIGNIHAK